LVGAGDIGRGDVLLAGGDIACGTIVAAANAVAMASPNDRWAVASVQVGVIAALAGVEILALRRWRRTADAPAA
jgi:hypothetical protein